jgi:hypothetical protein
LKQQHFGMSFAWFQLESVAGSFKENCDDGYADGNGEDDLFTG